MIFYLSCTGNTRWAAQKIADVTNDRMVSIPDAVMGDCDYHLHAGERIGFCLPVHGWRVQPMVREFVEKLRITTPSGVTNGLENIYCYYILTAGDSCGTYATQLENLLTAKGLRAQACCSLIMPESYVGLPFMDVDTDLREAEKKMKATGQLQRFADVLVDRRSVSMPIQCGSMPWLLSGVLGRFFYRFLITDKRFRCDESKCKGCGKCVKACPVGNMQMSGNTGGSTPQWLHNGRCLTCMACYHHCPEHAISFWCFTKNKGQYFFEHNRIGKKQREM